MTNWYGYPYIALTGGGDGALDSLDGSTLKDGDFAVVVVPATKNTYIYSLDEDSAATDDGVNVIAPDSNAGAKRWIRTNSPTGTNDVTYYGAVGDGATDDSAAIQAAVDAISGLGGGNIYFPRGDYLIETTVTVEHSDITLYGESIEGSRIVNGQAAAPAIKIGNGTDTFYRCAVRDLMFSQKAGVTGETGNCGLKLDKVGQCNLSDISFYQYPNELFTGLWLNASTQIYMYGISAQNCLDTGILFENNSFDLYLTNCRSDANVVYGFWVKDCQGVYAVNCSAYNNTVNGWKISSAGGDTNKFHFYTNCVGDTSGSYNWSIDQLYIGTFNGCWGSAQQNVAVNTSATGFIITGTAITDLTFNGCIAVSNNSHGFLIYEGQRIAVNGCIFGSSYTAGAANGKGGTGSGIYIAADAARVSVVGGTFNGNTDYGIEIANGAEQVYISGVELRYNTVGAVSNSANGAAGEAYLSACGGYNPLTATVTTPSVPSSTVAQLNLSGVDVDVYIIGGTVTLVSVDDAQVFTSTGCTVHLPAGAAIKITYSSVPTWKWIGR